MNWKMALAFGLGGLAAVGGCKKSTGGGTTGGGGGGGAWLVGATGLMQHLRIDGTLADYDLNAPDDLHGISCETSDTAFVVGAGGTFLRTSDGGATWQSIDLGTAAALRAVAAGAGTVYVAGDGVLERSSDEGDHWTAATIAGTWRSVATDAQGDVGLALASDGSIYRWAADGSIAQTGALAGAEAIAMSYDGRLAAAVGAGGAILESGDGGASWHAVASGTASDLHAAWSTGDAVFAVGDAGTIVRADASGAATIAQPGRFALRAVHVDGARGFAAGEGGEILATDDGGASWQVSPAHVAGTVLALDLVDADDQL